VTQGREGQEDQHPLPHGGREDLQEGPARDGQAGQDGAARGLPRLCGRAPRSRRRRQEYRVSGQLLKFSVHVVGAKNIEYQKKI
jgi:hypothetical protein